MSTILSEQVDFDLPASADYILDTKGLNCPLPILKTKQKLNQMAVGERLCVLATDTHAEIDFRAYLARVDYPLLYCAQQHAVFCFLIQKGRL